MHGPGVDEPIVWYEGSGTSDRRWLHQDRLGSVIAVSNGSGAATSINTYDEYGVPGSGNAGRFQYTGQMWIPEASLYHYKARAYAPSLGRFLQTDPILYAGGMNLYAYVGNDPVNLFDPSGQQGCPQPDGGGNCPDDEPGDDDPVDIWGDRPIWGGQICTSNCTRATGPPTVGANVGWNGERGLDDRQPDEARACPASGSLARSLPAQLGAAGLGIGDSFSFGLYSSVFSALPGSAGELYQQESRLVGYDVGFWIGAGLSVGRLGYAGVASGLRNLPGRQAVQARNNLKASMSSLGNRHPRLYTYEQMLARYGSDAAVSAAASRTDPVLNTAGGIGAVSAGTQAATGDRRC